MKGDHDTEIAMELSDLYLTDVRGKDAGLVLDPRVWPPKSKKRSTPVSKRNAEMPKLCSDSKDLETKSEYSIREGFQGNICF